MGLKSFKSDYQVFIEQLLRSLLEVLLAADEGCCSNFRLEHNGFEKSKVLPLDYDFLLVVSFLGERDGINSFFKQLLKFQEAICFQFYNYRVRMKENWVQSKPCRVVSPAELISLQPNRFYLKILKQIQRIPYWLLKLIWQNIKRRDSLSKQRKLALNSQENQRITKIYEWQVIWTIFCCELKEWQIQSNYIDQRLKQLAETNIIFYLRCDGKNSSKLFLSLQKHCIIDFKCFTPYFSQYTLSRPFNGFILSKFVLK